LNGLDLTGKTLRPDNQEEALLALGTPPTSRLLFGNEERPSGVRATSLGSYSLDEAVNSDLHTELARIQGLLQSVVHKKKRNQSNEVERLKRQLEEQEVATSIRQADASFLQQQLEEKDNLLREVSKILEVIEDRQTMLEQENARLKRELADLKRNDEESLLGSESNHSERQANLVTEEV
jgi:ribosomal protein S20